jgi:hypothetical protein
LINLDIVLLRNEAEFLKFVDFSFFALRWAVRNTDILRGKEIEALGCDSDQND